MSLSERIRQLPPGVRRSINALGITWIELSDEIFAIEQGEGVDWDYPIAGWLAFAIGALTSGVIWFLIFLVAKLLP